MAKTEVRVGQRYREVGANLFGRVKPLWTVDAVFTATDSLRYALLSNVADPTLQKTLSIHVLSNHQRFVPEASSGT